MQERIIVAMTFSIDNMIAEVTEGRRTSIAQADRSKHQPFRMEQATRWGLDRPAPNRIGEKDVLVVLRSALLAYVGDLGFPARTVAARGACFLNR